MTNKNEVGIVPFCLVILEFLTKMDSGASYW